MHFSLGLSLVCETWGKSTKQTHTRHYGCITKYGKIEPGPGDSNK